MIRLYKKLAYRLAERMYNKIQSIDKNSPLRKIYFAFDYFPKLTGCLYKVFLPLGVLCFILFNGLLFKDYPCAVIRGTETCALSDFIKMFLIMNIFFVGFLFVSLVFYYVGDFLLKRGKQINRG